MLGLPASASNSRSRRQEQSSTRPNRLLTTEVLDEYENQTQHLAMTLSAEDFFATVSVTFTLPVEQLSVLPRTATLDALQQVYCMIDQTFLPSKQSGLNKAAAALMQQVVENHGLLHAFIFAQLVRNQATQQHLTKHAEYYMLACHDQAVRFVNSRLLDADTQCDDTNILAVLALAYSGKVNSRKEVGTGPSQGPLKSLQLLDLYGGTIDAVPAHELGIAKMVQLRGGPKSIRLSGLAQMLSYADVIFSTRRLRTPSLPFVPSFRDDHGKILRSVRTADRPLCTLGSGFSVLDRLSGSAEAKTLQAALQQISLYVLAVDDYIVGSPLSQSLVVLADQRNMCQHGLLAMISSSTSDKAKQAIVQVCTAAAMVFSLLCVYPISAAPFSKCAAEVRGMLVSKSFEQVWREAPELATWIAVMGALAAIDTGHRTWFVAVLDRCLSRTGISTWEGLRGLLQDFLWLPATNDADGYDLWNEIQESNPFKMDDSQEANEVSWAETDNMQLPLNRSVTYP